MALTSALDVAMAIASKRVLEGKERISSREIYEAIKNHGILLDVPERAVFHALTKAMESKGWEKVDARSNKRTTKVWVLLFATMPAYRPVTNLTRVKGDCS